MSGVLERSGSANTGVSIANEAREVGPSEHADVCAGTEIVPEALLEPLGPTDSRGLLRQESAILLDDYLRKLAAQNVHCRLALGRLSARFLDTRAYQELGFARLGDYTRERLGVSRRTVEQAAQIARAIRNLPLISTAFERSALCWSKLRLLAGVVDRSSIDIGSNQAGVDETGDKAGIDEAWWLGQALNLTVRELAALVSSRKDEPSSGIGMTQGNAGAAAAVGTDAVSTQTTAPSYATQLSMDAEDESATFRVSCPRRVRRLWSRAQEYASRMAGASLSAWQVAELVAAETASLRPFPVDDPSDVPSPTDAGTLASSRRHEPREPSEQDDSHQTWSYAEAWCKENDSDPERGFVWLDTKTIAQAIPVTVQEDAARAPAMSARQLDAALRRVRRAMQRIDWQLGRLLSQFFDSHLYEQLGFPTPSHYVRSRLGICESKTRALLALERQSRIAGDEFTQAYRIGEISWLRALALLPVMSDRHSAAWLDRARRVTLQRLNDEITWALDRMDEQGPIARPPTPPQLGARLVPLDRVAPVPMCAHSDRLEIESSATPFVCIGFRGPAPVVFFFQGAIAAYRMPDETRWRGLERILVHVLGQWCTQPRHSDPVFQRDGWRCAVPACSSRRELQDHHIVFRSRGGKNDRSNRVSICAWHHLRGIHGGRVELSGEAPHDLLWRLGVANTGSALLMLRGDTYLSGTPTEVA